MLTLTNSEDRVVTRVICERCKDHEPALLMRSRSQSGVSMPFWFCLNCQQPATKPTRWLSHNHVHAYGAEPDRLPLYGNNPAVRCIRCGALGAEWHRWAPKEVFADAEEWPGGYLCVPCHRTWHDSMIGYTCGGRP
jgi:hypothetical protein